MNRRTLLLAFACTVPLATRAGWRRDNAAACARIDEKLADIAQQRRVGYTPKRGRQLDAQRERLTKQRREMCR